MSTSKPDPLREIAGVRAKSQRFLAEHPNHEDKHRVEDFIRELDRFLKLPANELKREVLKLKKEYDNQAKCRKWEVAALTYGWLSDDLWLINSEINAAKKITSAT